MKSVTVRGLVKAASRMSRTCSASGASPFSANAISASVGAFRCVTARSGSNRCDDSTRVRFHRSSICRTSASDRRQSCWSLTTWPSAVTRLAATWMWSPWLTTAKPSNPMPLAQCSPIAACSASESARSSGAKLRLMCAT